jgi:hypothetical protein
MSCEAGRRVARGRRSRIARPDRSQYELAHPVQLLGVTSLRRSREGLHALRTSAQAQAQKIKELAQTVDEIVDRLVVVAEPKTSSDELSLRDVHVANGIVEGDHGR